MRFLTRITVCCLALTAALAGAGCSEHATNTARERMTRLGETVQSGTESTRESLQRLGEATQQGVEGARARLERAGDRVLSGKEALERRIEPSAAPAEHDSGAR